MNPQSLFIYW